MSDIKDGGPAFSRITSSKFSSRDDAVFYQSAEGMSLRDYFAAKVIQGMAARDSFDPGQATPDQRATLAYIDADAMLKARGAQ